MGYNKARAERAWLNWKSQEENQLRTLGVEEEVIQALRQFDWETFKRDRCYYEHLADLSPGELPLHNPNQPKSIESVSALLDEIDNELLLAILQKQDGVTLKIMLFKMLGYTSKEIGLLVGLEEFTVRKRISRLRNKLKRVLL